MADTIEYRLYDIPPEQTFEVVRGDDLLVVGVETHRIYSVRRYYPEPTVRSMEEIEALLTKFAGQRGKCIPLDPKVLDGMERENEVQNAIPLVRTT